MLQRVINTLNEIKSTLLNNEVVRKLLFNDSKSCLTMSAPTKDAVDSYITTHPIYQFQNKEMYEQNGMVNIVVPTVTVDDDSNYISGVIQVNVVFNIDRWDLDGGKIRPLELCDKIIELLDKKKFSMSNPLKLSIINDLIINKQVVGYALLFDFDDGNSEIENF